MTTPLTQKVLLIGWDAADWKVITPLLDAGKMPHLEKFVSQGVMGNLATLSPVLSPMLWTSIATGKRAYKHGIHGFTEPDPQGRGVRPVTNLGRKTKAVWNILNQTGRRSIVVGWWPSHPAEPINGVMVSNHYQDVVAPLDKPWPMRPGIVHPPRLAGPLSEFRYQFHDLMLGALLALASEDTTVIIVSDHGFHPDHLRPKELPNEPAGPAEEHRPFGVFAMKGPGVKRDQLVYGASLLDITPTILTLYGLPLGRDMDGKPLLTALTDPPAIEYVESWDAVPGEAGTHPADVQIDPVDAQEALKQLVELGYIGKPDESKEKAVAATIKELRYNLARDYADARHFVEAIPIFESLWNDYPDESRFGIKLFESQLALGRPAGARQALERLVREKQRYALEAQEELKRLSEEWKDKKPEDLKQDEQQQLNKLRKKAGVNPAAFAYLRGSLLHAEGNHEQALEELQKAEQVQVHNRPSLYQEIGEVLLSLQRWDEAAARFNQILAVDPINPAVRLGLCQCHLAQRRPRKALNEAMAAIGLIYHNPRAHYLCGLALQRLGRTQEAMQAFQTALAQNPVFPDAHRALARLHTKRFEHPQAAQHEQLAQAAEQRIAAFKAGRPLPEDVDLELDISLTEPASLGELGATVPSASLKETVVIVSGLPRSGTSMLMQMLAAGGLPILTDGQRAADESNPRGYYEFEAAKKVGKDNTWLEQAKGKAVKIVAQLLPGLPPGPYYRIIFMERPLGEVVASQQAMLQRMGREGGKLSERQLAATYRRQLDGVRQVLAAHPERVSVLAVNYHQALADPAVMAVKVNAFLGGSLDEAAMAAAVAPELRHQRCA